MSKPWGLMADLHLHPWSAFAETGADGVNSRLRGLFKEIHRCARIVRDAGGDTVVMAGDVFHVRGSVAPVVLNSMIHMLRDMNLAYGTKFVIIAGNHDLEGRESTRLGSAVTALECGYVTTLSEQTVADGKLYVPWIENIEALKKALTEARDTLVANGDRIAERDLILHAPIDGVIPGLPDHGLTPQFLCDLGFRRVFSGHYHNHKQMHPGVAMGDPSVDPRFFGEVWSIGALAHHTWSDVGSKAGFLIVSDTEVKWMDSHLPKFVDLRELAMSESPEEMLELVSGNYVRVRVEASKVKEIDAARAELKAMGAAGVLVQPEPKPEAGETRESTLKAGASLEVSVTDFVDSIKECPDAAAVKRAALEVLSTVSTVD